MTAIMGADVAMGHDEHCARWIQKFRDRPPPAKPAPAAAAKDAAAARVAMAAHPGDLGAA
jgi:5-methyltetrahydrofolate--homocysteine methyltransferase